MREGDNRRLQGQLEQLSLDDAAHDETLAVDDHQRFSSQGPLPAVASDEMVMKPSASELVYGHEGNALAPPKQTQAVAKKVDPHVEETKQAPSQLLIAFAAKFPDAAKLIEVSPKAQRFVRESEAAGAKFGGFAEDGPGGSAWPYTSGDTVYIPKAHGDGIQAMSDFLFELNNAVRAPRFDELYKQARKGSKGSLTATSYARKTVELEVEGMLKLGEVWFETKKAAHKEKDATWSANDGHFYLAQYEAFKAGKKTKDDIIDGVLQSKYDEGADAGKTVEQFYMEQYEAIAARGAN